MEKLNSVHIHAQLTELIQSRLSTVINGSLNKNKVEPKIHNQSQMDSLLLFSSTVEQLTLDLIDEYRKDPAAAPLILNLVVEVEKCVECDHELQKWQERLLGRPRRKPKHRYPYILEFFEFMHDYLLFLRYFLLVEELTEPYVRANPPSRAAVKAGSAGGAETMAKPAPQPGEEEIPIRGESLAFKVTLLSELGFFNLPEVEPRLQYKKRRILQKLIGGSDRTLEGLMNVLNPNGAENPLRFTSHKHVERVRKFLDSLGF